MEFLVKFKESLGSCEDHNNFNHYLLPHGQLIFKSACRLCGDVNHAEDLVQETFYFALKNFSQLRNRDKCKYWLFSILRNLFLKDIEKSKSRIEIEFDSVCEALHNNTSPEIDYLQEELKRNIKDALGALDLRLRKPILMFYFDGMSYKEIGDNLGIPIGTVMSRIARGKVYLKKKLVESGSFHIELNRTHVKIF